MILLSAVHAVVVGGLLFGGAALAAHLLRARNRDERWVWASALAGAVVLPPALRVLPLGLPDLFPTSTPGQATDAGTPWLDGLVPEVVAGPVASAPDWVSTALIATWALMSTLLALRLLVGLETLRRVRGRSRPLGASKLPLRRTDSVGPAIVGFLRPVILLPEWVLRLPPADRHWIVRHEVEHLLGRDPALLALALGTRIAVPWNPFVWLLGRRLLAAVEIDCDRRTLNAPSSDVRTYAEALLKVARGPEVALPAGSFAFAEPRLPLETRIRSMTAPRRPASIALRLGLLGIAVLVLALACEVPEPSPTEGSDAAPEAVTVEEKSAAASEGPVFTPMTERPRLENAQEVRQALRDAYPDALRDAGIGGQVTVWFYIDAEGQVDEVRVAQESEHPALDRAALEVARTFRFKPALNGETPVAVWVQFPIVFRTPS